MPLLSLSKNPGVDKGPQPLMALLDWRHVRQIRKKRLRSKAFPAFGAGRAIGASTG